MNFGHIKKSVSLIYILTIALVCNLDTSPATQYKFAGIYDNEYTTPNFSVDSLQFTEIVLNGDTSDQLISYITRDDNILIDAQAFFEIVDGQYYPFWQNYGLTVQYGKIISFAAIHHAQGFVACKKIDMLPPIELVNNTIMVPINFLAQSIGGNLHFNHTEQQLNITVTEPVKIGDVISEAKNLADILYDENYIIQQGSINLANAIEFYAAGYTPDCNGNNANFPYLVIQSPPSPGAPFVFTIPPIYNMRSDEAFVIIGRTPPECTYYSYRSYLGNRYYEDETPNRLKLYASLGDTKNLYNITEGRNNTDVFNRFFMLISTADKNIEQAVRNAAIRSGIIEDDIFLDVIPADIVRFGLDGKADFLSFLHRVSLFEDQNEKDQYINSPTLEVLRVTPSTPVTPDYLPTPNLRVRGSGYSEYHLSEGFEQLRDAVIQRYGDGYEIIELQSSQWLIEGLEAIQTRTNVIGETRDALYLRTDTFEFHENDIIVVFGVNHTKTNKAVYCNISCYGAELFNGFGGITNIDYEGTSNEYLSDPLLTDYFYVWKFARDSIDNHTFVVPEDINKNFTGINYGSKSFIGFRSYVEPATTIGPASWEIIMDQAVLFRPKNTNVENNNECSLSENPELKIYPNPFNSETIIHFNSTLVLDIQISAYNIRGQLVKELFSEADFSGSGRIIWTSKDLNELQVSSGIYLIKMIYRNHVSNKQNTQVRKILLIR